MEKIEVLSPAGSMESLIAAIHAGCDAVYLGGVMFGARAFAGNFNNEELIEAINLAHLYGVKVYVTCNILILEHEVDKFIEYVGFLHKNNVDAIIIQDIGMLDLVHKTYPNLELHASTQMHIHNADGAIMAKRLGCKRVVLARETPIEEIEKIKKTVDVDLEIFAHGALCVSYSGQCLFSSLIGNRSGNRGSCVGSCRLPYKIVDEKDKIISKNQYPLSMKDLNTLDYIDKLIEANVTSLKIEGRMKSPEYVYTVTKLYRMAVDSYYKNKKIEYDKKELENLTKIFSRGFTKGYLFNENYKNILSNKPNHMGIQIGTVISSDKNYVTIKLQNKISIFDGIRIISDEDYGLVVNEIFLNNKIVKEANKGDTIKLKVNKKIKNNSIVLLTKDNNLINEINNKIKLKQRKVNININATIKENKKIYIELFTNKEKVSIESIIPEKSLNNPVTKESIIKSLSKLGDTIYNLETINIDLDNNLFVPISLFNNLRRELIEKLNNMRLYKIEYKTGKYNIQIPDFKKEKLKALLTSDTKNITDKYDIIYSLKEEENAITKIPKIIQNYNKYNKNITYLVGELGALNYFNNVITDYSLNVTNSYTVALLHSLGAKRITLSYELTKKQIENIIKAYKDRYNKNPNLEIVTYGYREVMSLKTDLIDIYQNQNIKLLDKFGNKYKIKKINNINYIYDYKLLNDNENYYDIGINVIRENKEI